MALVLVAILFVLTIVGFARPYIGFLALLIVMELQPGELYPSLLPFHLERIIAGLVLVAFVMHGAKWRFPAPTRWFLAFYGAMIVSIPLAYWRTNSLVSCISFLEILVLCLLATALLTTENRIRSFVLISVLLFDWLGGSALYNYHHGIWQYRQHIERAIGITSSAGDPNTLALTVLSAIPLSIALLVRSNALWVRCIGIASIVFGVATIVDTGSRASAFGLVFLVLLLMARKPKSFIYLPFLIALSPVVWMMVPQQYKARYETVDNLKADESFQLRKLSWQGGVAMFESNPITGVGAGNYATANGEKYWPGTGHKIWLDAHSLYFKLLGELGLVGIFTFGGYLICLFRLNWRLRKEFLKENSSSFLKILPSMLSVILCQLLFAGYAAHDLYRIQWFTVGAMAASLSLLPAFSQNIAVEESAGQSTLHPPGTLSPTGATHEWSGSLLPVLRKQVPVDGPRG